MFLRLKRILDNINESVFVMMQNKYHTETDMHAHKYKETLTWDEHRFGNVMIDIESLHYCLRVPLDGVIDFDKKK